MEPPGSVPPSQSAFELQRAPRFERGSDAPRPFLRGGSGGVTLGELLSPSSTSAGDACTAFADTDADQIDREVITLYDRLDVESVGAIQTTNMIQLLRGCGIHSSIIKDALKCMDPTNTGSISFTSFSNGLKLVRNPEVIKKAINNKLAIPDFAAFTGQLKKIVAEVSRIHTGEVASYIPQLSNVNPELFAVAIHTVDGQVWATGDFREYFTVQSCCKPVAFAIALRDRGHDVNRYVGHEPSGKGFNDFSLNRDRKPYNPLINSGAIVISSLLWPELDPAERFQNILGVWTALAGHPTPPIGFDNATYLSELRTADRNFALAHLLKDEKCFPSSVGTKQDLDRQLQLYLQNCAIQVNARHMAAVAATFANRGIQPVTRERVFSVDVVRNTLSAMFSCGMYDESGEFAYSIGLPAKSSVSGAVMVVVPGLMGICVWSPRLNRVGNSVRAMEFCKRLTQRFTFHIFDDMENKDKINPRVLTERDDDSKDQTTMMKYAILYAAGVGDVGFLRSLVSAGVSVNMKDHDGRTPLHCAASAGNLAIVTLLLDRGAIIDAHDRYNVTPYEEAEKHGNKPVIELLESRGAHKETKEEKIRRQLLRAVPRERLTKRRTPSPGMLPTSSSTPTLDSVPFAATTTTTSSFLSADSLRSHRPPRERSRTLAGAPPTRPLESGTLSDS